MNLYVIVRTRFAAREVRASISFVERRGVRGGEFDRARSFRLAQAGRLWPSLPALVSLGRTRDHRLARLQRMDFAIVAFGLRVRMPFALSQCGETGCDRLAAYFDSRDSGSRDSADPARDRSQTVRRRPLRRLALARPGLGGPASLARRLWVFSARMRPLVPDRPTWNNSRTSGARDRLQQVPQ